MLKEFALPKDEQGKATIVLSKMSTDFVDLKERLLQQNLFEDVIEYDEKPYWFFDELTKYKKDYHFFLKNLVNRIIFTKKFAKLQEQFVPVDFSLYKDVYVYCDSDPIGYYLNYKKVPYHSVEDGLNCMLFLDAARYDNRGNFKIKALLAACNLLFIQNGYSKYCVDVEVNQIEGLRYPLKKHREVSREALFNRLTAEEKGFIIEVFVKDKSQFMNKVGSLSQDKKRYLILTQPLCTLDVREKIFRDLVEEYSEEAEIILKPHPRDELDYTQIFTDITILDKMVPMEVLNCLGEKYFDKVIAILTEIKGIYFAKEIIRLGVDFMDKYEDAAIHRQSEQF